MMRNIFCVALLVLTVSALAQKRDQLTGTWTVTMTNEDNGKTFEDTLTFKGDKLTSKYFGERGFAAMDYEADLRGVQTINFTAAGKSETEGKTAWTGSASLGAMTGTVKWTKADGSEVTLALKGRRNEK
jgi:hypothetical protein